MHSKQPSASNDNPKAEPKAGLSALPQECRVMVRSYLTATEALRHFLALENMKIFLGAEKVVLRDAAHQQKRDELLAVYNATATNIIALTRLELLSDAPEVRSVLERESKRLRAVMKQNEALYLVCIENVNARIDQIMQRIDGSGDSAKIEEGVRHVTH